MKVLLVEDDPVSMLICKNFLNKLGHEVVASENAEMAWLEIIAGKFQIVISDWSLPKTSGIELCKKIRGRKSPDYTHFILITSYHGVEKLTEAMDAGVDDFLSKPIDLETLAIRLTVSIRMIEFHKQIGILKEMLPICMYCKKIRNDGTFWETVESYFSAHTGTDFTHSLCPDCYTEHVLPEIEKLR